jgi:hypothetical protein
MASFGMMRTNADTFAAVDAELAGDDSPSVPNPDRLCRASFNTIDAAVT